MTPKERAAMQQALEALELDVGCPNIVAEEAITALREALAEQAEQEPDYFGLTHDHTWLSIEKKQYDKLKPEGRMACYAAPVRTKDLTDEELNDIWYGNTKGGWLGLFRAVIAADRELNK